MSDIEKLSVKMRDDWNRRIRHDYRFWMSDGQSDDVQMWQTGERDLKILLRDISNLDQKSVLDLGCGVGRLVRPISKIAAKVIGVDVSEEAITRARELVGPQTNVDLIVGNGHDLHQISSESIDVAYSFAALTSMPTIVIANYLRELWRILKPDGTIRLQVYLGRPQEVNQSDTLFLRCYNEENFAQALSLAGFKRQWSEELLLPFQVSVKESGIVAMIVSLEKEQRNPASKETIANTLLPNGEKQESFAGSELEYWMSIQYAKEHIKEGRKSEARAALEHALKSVNESNESLDNIYRQLESEIQESSASLNHQSLWMRNLDIIRKRFPELLEQIEKSKSSGCVNVEVNSTEQGPVINFEKQCQDHPNKPISAARIWVERLLTEKRFLSAKEILVFGFGSGYHIEELLSHGSKISVIEPAIDVFTTALVNRDLTSVLERVERLFVGSKLSAAEIGMGVELAIRPQTQASHIQFCNQIKGISYETRGLTSLHPMVAVLGPLQGGTLPIAGYSSHALHGLRQRHRDLNVSGFNSSFQLIEQFLKEEPRQKVMHGNFIELISQLVLEHSWEKPFDILICMAQAPISGRALNELRKRGVITVLWFVEDYLRFTYWKSMAQYYDFVFTIQKGECIDVIKQAGAGEVHYLPTACCPEIHAPMSLSPEDKTRWGSPLSFVGAGYYNRQQVFASFADLPFRIWGTEWPTCRPFDAMVQEEGRRLSPAEYVKIFNATDININLHSSVERDDVDPSGDFVNPRTFELASCGAFQLVDERSLLDELFEPGVEVATFRNKTDLKEKIEYYLSRPDERQKIALAGRERALRDHTYNQRFKRMLSIIYGSKFEHLSRRLAQDPWSKMIQRADAIDSELKARCEKAFESGEVAKLDALIADIHSGKGNLSTTEQKLLFLHHIRRQIINITREEVVVK